MLAEMINSAFGGKPMKKGKSGKSSSNRTTSKKDKASKESALINSIRSAGFDF